MGTNKKNAFRIARRMVKELSEPVAVVYDLEYARNYSEAVAYYTVRDKYIDEGLTTDPSIEIIAILGW